METDENVGNMIKEEKLVQLSKTQWTARILYLF